MAVVALRFAGCCRCKMIQRKYGKPLEETEWQLVQCEGHDVTPSEKFTLVFAKDGVVSGLAECNRLTGRYKENEAGKMQIMQVGSTRMMCQDMQMEQRFLTVLQNVTDYKMDGPMLMLICDGEMSLIFQAKDSEPVPSRK